MIAGFMIAGFMIAGFTIAGFIIGVGEGEFEGAKPPPESRGGLRGRGPQHATTLGLSGQTRLIQGGWRGRSFPSMPHTWIVRPDRDSFNRPSDNHPFNRFLDNHPFNRFSNNHKFNRLSHNHSFNRLSDNHPFNRLSDNHPFNHPTGYNPLNINIPITNQTFYPNIA